MVVVSCSHFLGAQAANGGDHEDGRGGGAACDEFVGKLGQQAPKCGQGNYCIATVAKDATCLQTAGCAGSKGTVSTKVPESRV